MSKDFVDFLREEVDNIKEVLEFELDAGIEQIRGLDGYAITVPSGIRELRIKYKVKEIK